MTAPPDDLPGFAPNDDAPIPYMARTREYYQAIGYTTPYRWAHYVGAPFQRLRKPLGQSRVALVTTAAPFDPAKGDQGPGAKYNGGAKFHSVYDGDTSKPHDLRISHIAYDRLHTSADDSGTWFRAYGNENWEFAEDGLMTHRHASINEHPIHETYRKFRWPLGRRPDDHPGLSSFGF